MGAAPLQKNTILKEWGDADSTPKARSEALARKVVANWGWANRKTRRYTLFNMIVDGPITSTRNFSIGVRFRWNQFFNGV